MMRIFLLIIALEIYAAIPYGARTWMASNNGSFLSLCVTAYPNSANINIEAHQNVVWASHSNSIDAMSVANNRLDYHVWNKTEYYELLWPDGNSNVCLPIFYLNHKKDANSTKLLSTDNEVQALLDRSFSTWCDASAGVIKKPQQILIDHNKAFNIIDDYSSVVFRLPPDDWNVYDKYGAIAACFYKHEINQRSIINAGYCAIKTIDILANIGQVFAPGYQDRFLDIVWRDEPFDIDWDQDWHEMKYYVSYSDVFAHEIGHALGLSDFFYYEKQFFEQTNPWLYYNWYGVSDIPTMMGRLSVKMHETMDEYLSLTPADIWYLKFLYPKKVAPQSYKRANPSWIDVDDEIIYDPRLYMSERGVTFKKAIVEPTGNVTAQSTGTISFKEGTHFKAGSTLSTSIVNSLVPLSKISSNEIYEIEAFQDEIIDSLSNDSSFNDFQFEKILPNPFNASTMVSFTIKGVNKLSTLGIYDIRGALIKKIHSDAPLSAGKHLFSWNGRDNFENSVATGTYLCRAELGGKTYFTKLIFVK